MCLMSYVHLQSTLSTVYTIDFFIINKWDKIVSCYQTKKIVTLGNIKSNVLLLSSISSNYLASSNIHNWRVWKTWRLLQLWFLVSFNIMLGLFIKIIIYLKDLFQERGYEINYYNTSSRLKILYIVMIWYLNMQTNSFN